ncbi:hypothetical protein [uncultured Helicobacter sp.]|nr:hypothetical protein [uncultured Helicobacter sp.]
MEIRLLGSFGALGLRALRFCGLSLQALAWQFNKKNSSSQPKESYA